SATRTNDNRVEIQNICNALHKKNETLYKKNSVSHKENKALVE
ncbi:2351_t:CDS:1, partial [Cetraspora pellucida]